MLIHAYLIENRHLQNTLVMSPQFTLQPTFSNTPNNFIRLEMKTLTNILKHPLLLPLDNRTVFGEVLDYVLLWTTCGRMDYDSPAFETDCYDRLHTVKGDAAAQGSLSCELAVVGLRIECQIEHSTHVDIC